MSRMLRLLCALLVGAPLLAPRAALADEGSVIRVVRKGEPVETRAAPPTEKQQEPSENEGTEVASTSRAENDGGRSAAKRERPAELPRARAAPRYVPSIATEREDGGPRVLPWVTLGASAALGVIGAVFATEASSALNDQDFDLEIVGNQVIVTDAFRDAQSRAVDNTIISTALLSTAAAGALMSIILLIED